MQRRFGRREREQAAATLHPTSRLAAERLQRFVRDGGAVVTTGQQAGLFTGPLYTIYKILTAVRLADVLERALGIVVLPVFWTASEDHDWAEVNHTHIIDPTGELRRIEASSPDPHPLPMSERVLDSSIETAVDQLSYITSYASVATDYVTLIRDAYRTGSTVAGAFREVVQTLLAPFHLLVTDAANPALKAASVPTLLREVEEATEHEARLSEQTARLTRAGYHAQVAVLPDAANLFFHGPQGRERLYRRGSESWYTHESRQTFTHRELAQRLREEPGRFSPNVFLRPVVESAVFPTLAYVAGPGEISYFGQLGGLFEAFGMTAPVVFPRLSALLIDDKIQHALDGLGLPVDMMSAPLHELETQIARGAMPDVIETALRDLRGSTVEGYERLMGAAYAIDPTLAGPLGANRNAMLGGLARSEDKILRHIKRRDDDRLSALRRARASLYPEGKPQERMLNVFSFLLRHGPGLLEELAGKAMAGLPDELRRQR